LAQCRLVGDGGQAVGAGRDGSAAGLEQLGEDLGFATNFEEIGKSSRTSSASYVVTCTVGAARRVPQPTRCGRQPNASGKQHPASNTYKVMAALSNDAA